MSATNELESQLDSLPDEEWNRIVADRQHRVAAKTATSSPDHS